MASREGQKVYLKSLKWKRFFHLYLTCLFRVIHCSLHICWHWPHSNVWIAWRNFLFLNWFLSFLPYVPTKWSTMDLWIIVLFFLAVAQLVNTLHFLSTLTSISSRYSAVIDFAHYLYSSRSIQGTSFLMCNSFKCCKKSHLLSHFHWSYLPH